MTSEQKETIKTLRLQGQSISVIAATLNLPPNTVKSFLQREQKKKEFCKHCRKPLIHLKGRKRKTFCGDECRYDWWKSHRYLIKHNTVYHAVCAYCGKEFESSGKGRKYCSHPCYIAERFGVP